ncbi:MAG TPA: FAD-dependent oxidoreductase [Thermodesulfobacteriota bacterium]|nr:FAD-dependent oxidoreductase [Thermodesulfobacteriota bacterium]
MKYPKLFSPLSIGSMHLKNRIAMAPMATHFADESGAVTSRLIDYYAERARGGAGLILLESGYIHPSGRGGIRRLGLHEDRLIPGLKELVKQVHLRGAKISTQLHHAGRQINALALNGIFPVSCSSIAPAMEGIVPRALKIAEIEELVEAFGQGAWRSVKAGFDAILIHGAHGYLIHQFLSPCSNTRKDRYGGTFLNRLRFLREIIQRCRKTVGKDFPIMVRISAAEFIPGGLTVKDGQKIARHLESWGIDAIHVSGGTHETQEMELQPMALPRGCLVSLAEAIKKAVSIPVATVGRIVDPRMAEEVLRKGKADLITMGRALLADPDFPRKAQKGKVEDIRPCIACLQGCRERLYQGESITCLVNPAAGQEREHRLTSVPVRKKVWVIGGGPGGMEAAWIAALRGHDVTLWEKKDHLGGQFHLASLVPCREEIKVYLDFLTRQLEKARVKINLGQEVTPEKLSRTDAQGIILASGAFPKKSGIPGAEREEVLTAWEALASPEKVGSNVVLIGGGAVGAETADFLTQRGKEVTLVEMGKEIARDEERTTRKLLLQRLGEKGTRIRVLTEAKAILAEGVQIEFKEGQEFLPADTVVLATGVTPDRTLETPLKKLEIEFYAVGDCVKPQKAIEAIHEGFLAACKI